MSRLFSMSRRVVLQLLVLAAAAPCFAQQVIVDNEGAGFSILNGTWSTGAFGNPWNTNYNWDDTSGGGTSLVEWRPDLPEAGEYQVETWYIQGGNRANNAPFTIHHTGGSTTVHVNQQVAGEVWLNLGEFTFNAGTGGFVTLGNDANPSVVIADAVRFTLVGDPQPLEEFRGMWISRFEWPHSNLAVVINNITNVMASLEANNFNAAIFQVRGQADTLFPSPNEPWSPLLSSDGNEPPGWNGFDPMDFAITQAHNRGLEFHAYINTHTAWQAGSCTVPAQKPTYDLDHVFWDHFDADNPSARDWLVHDDLGNPVQCEESNYTWIAAGVPDAQAYIREQVMHVVENYDVDGVHFDRIRTPGTEFSHDPISEARRSGEGNPDGLGFADWTRDQITRFNRDIYAQIMEVKPFVKVSSAPLGLYSSDRYPGYPAGPCGFFYGYSCVYQDAQAWLAAGAQDFIVPQIYWADGGANPDFSDILPDWLANSAGRHIYAGQITSVGGTQLISQINVTRTMGGQGNTVFSFGSFTSGSSYTAPGGPYENPAVVPPMPWKDNPTLGIIIGNVSDASSGDPIVDAHVTRSGSSYTALSSGDGLYSFLLVPPGTYTLSFDKLGVGSRTVPNVNVVAGGVTRVNVVLPPVPGDFDGDGDVDDEDAGAFALCMFGPVVPVDPSCVEKDLDMDGDVDLRDADQLMQAATP